MFKFLQIVSQNIGHIQLLGSPLFIIHFTHALNNVSPARHFIIILQLAVCSLHGLLFDLESGGDFRLFLLVFSLVYFSTLKMETICSS
jgi:hypothetical protein